MASGTGIRLLSVLLVIFVFDHAYCRPNGDSNSNYNSSDSADSMGDRGHWLNQTKDENDNEATTPEYEDHFREFKVVNENDEENSGYTGRNNEETSGYTGRYDEDDEEFEDNESGAGGFFTDIFKGISNFFDGMSKSSNKFVEKIGNIFDKIGDFFFGGGKSGSKSPINNTLRFEEDANDVDCKFSKPKDDDNVGIYPRKMHVYKRIGEKQEIDCFPHKAILTGPHVNSGTYDAVRDDNYGRYYLNTMGRGNFIKFDMENLQKNDSGQYNCTLGEYHKSFNLQVLDPIVFDANLTTQIVHNVSEDFHMSCHATGDHLMKLNITWEVDQRPVYKHDPNGISTMEYKRYDIDDHNNLIIKKPLTHDDMHRVYMCIATESIEHRAEHDGHMESEGYSFSNSTRITLAIAN